MEVSENGGTPKSSILMGCSIINQRAIGDSGCSCTRKVQLTLFDGMPQDISFVISTMVWLMEVSENEGTPKIIWNWWLSMGKPMVWITQNYDFGTDGDTSWRDTYISSHEPAMFLNLCVGTTTNWPRSFPPAARIQRNWGCESSRDTKGAITRRRPHDVPTHKVSHV